MLTEQQMEEGLKETLAKFLEGSITLDEYLVWVIDNIPLSHERVITKIVTPVLESLGIKLIKH